MLLRKFVRGDTEAVSFKFYLTGILVCCMYQEFINAAEQLFTSMDRAATGTSHVHTHTLKLKHALYTWSTFGDRHASPLAMDSPYA